MAYTLLQQTIYAWFHQIPKEEAAIFALVVFFLIGVANLVITCRTKAWFMVTVAVTAALEVAGYAFRIVMLHKPAYGPFVAMQALLIIPPIFLALVDYSAVGKLMRVAKRGGRLNPAWVSCSATFGFNVILHLCRQYALPCLLPFIKHSAQVLLSAKGFGCLSLTTKTTTCRCPPATNQTVSVHRWYVVCSLDLLERFSVRCVQHGILCE